MSFDEVESETEPSGQAVRAQIKAIAQNPRALIRRRWLWIAIALVVGIFATATVCVSLKPMFAARATVLVADQQNPGKPARSTGAKGDSPSIISVATREILSQESLGNLINEYGLYSEELRSTELPDVITLMRENISIRAEQDNASVFLIEYLSSNPEIAALIANEIADRFLDATLRHGTQQNQTSNTFMERELAHSEEELSSIKASIVKFHASHGGAGPADQKTILEKLERLATRRKGLKNQIRSEDERMTALGSANETEDSNESDRRLASLKLALVTQLAIHSADHPNVISLQQQIEQLDVQLEAANKISMRSTLANENQIAIVLKALTSLQRKLAKLDSEKKSLDKRASQIRKNAAAYEALTQSATVLEEDNLAFARKIQAGKSTKHFEPSQHAPQPTALDRASPPTESISWMWLYLPVGLAISIVLAMLAALLAEFIDPMVLDPEHFMHIGGPPVLGSIYSR